jgi:hypothetical protein
MGVLVSVIVGPFAGIALTAGAAGAGIVAVALFFCALSYLGSVVVWAVGMGRGAKGARG